MVKILSICYDYFEKCNYEIYYSKVGKIAEKVITSSKLDNFSK